MLVSSCVVNHSYCEFVFAMAMPCPEDSISQHSAPILLCFLSVRVLCALETLSTAEH